MSSNRTQKDNRPTLPPIRDVFRDELYSIPRTRPESPSLTLARLRVDDDVPQISRGSPHYPRDGTYSTYSRSSANSTQQSSATFPPSSRYAEYPRGVPAYPSQVPYTYPHPAYQNPPSRSHPYGYETQERTPVARYPPQQSLPHDSRYVASDNHRAYSQHRNDQVPVGSSHRYYDASGPSSSQIPPHAADHSLSSGSKYECSYCGKGFNRPSSLKIHLNSHTGEKPFQCPVEGCGRSFSVLSNMRRHARVHSHPSKDGSGDEESEGHPSPRGSSHARLAPSPNLSAARWQHHRRDSSASTSSSSSRRSHGSSSDSGDELDFPSRSDKRSRPYDYGK